MLELCGLRRFEECELRGHKGFGAVIEFVDRCEAGEEMALSLLLLIAVKPGEEGPARLLVGLIAASMTSLPKFGLWSNLGDEQSPPS
jgi:hypothetical protein